MKGQAVASNVQRGAVQQRCRTPTIDVRLRGSVAVPASLRCKSMRIPAAGIPDAMFSTCVVSLPMVSCPSDRLLRHYSTFASKSNLLLYSAKKRR